MKNLKLLGLCSAFFIAGSSYASAVVHEINDDYIGATQHSSQNGQDVMYGQQSSLGIYRMTVERSDNNLMTVKIYTNVVNSVGTEHSNNNYIYYGDLFMSVNSSGDNAAWEPYGTGPGYNSDGFNNTGNPTTGDTTWEYVYDINGARDHDNDFVTDTSSAELKEFKNVSATTNSNNYDMGTYRDQQAYKLAWNTSNAVDIINDGARRDVRIQRDGVNNDGDDYLEFIFDVTDTDLEDATQIAFHWTSSLAKDVIEGVVNFGGGTTTGGTVAEPAALGLMLAGLAGFGLARRRKVLGQ